MHKGAGAVRRDRKGRYHVNDTERFFVQRMGGQDGPYVFADIRISVMNGAVRADTLLRRESGGDWFRAAEVPGLFSRKEWLVALLLSIFAGTLGIDRFYLGHVGLGLLKLFTFGGLGVWSLIDIIMIATDKMRDDQGLPLKR
jgi:hypothetical protein